MLNCETCAWKSAETCRVCQQEQKEVNRLEAQNDLCRVAFDKGCHAIGITDTSGFIYGFYMN